METLPTENTRTIQTQTEKIDRRRIKRAPWRTMEKEDGTK